MSSGWLVQIQLDSGAVDCCSIMLHSLDPSSWLSSKSHTDADRSITTHVVLYDVGRSQSTVRQLPSVRDVTTPYGDDVQLSTNWPSSSVSRWSKAVDASFSVSVTYDDLRPDDDRMSSSRNASLDRPNADVFSLRRNSRRFVRRENGCMHHVKQVFQRSWIIFDCTVAHCTI